jgi:hypothetical protein
MIGSVPTCCPYPSEICDYLRNKGYIQKSEQIGIIFAECGNAETEENVVRILMERGFDVKIVLFMDNIPRPHPSIETDVVLRLMTYASLLKHWKLLQDEYPQVVWVMPGIHQVSWPCTVIDTSDAMSIREYFQECKQIFETSRSRQGKYINIRNADNRLGGYWRPGSNDSLLASDLTVFVYEVTWQEKITTTNTSLRRFVECS